MTDETHNQCSTGKIKRIHVNQHVIKANKKNGENQPVFTVKTSNDNIYGREVEILGPSKMVYSPKKPLSCGAKCWCETTAEVLVDGVSIK